MKLIRFGTPGNEKPGLILDDGRHIDTSAFGSDYDESFFGGDGLARLAVWAEKNAASAPTIPADTRLGPCIARPSKIVCIGLNYADHAKESGAASEAMRMHIRAAGKDMDLPSLKTRKSK